MFKQQPATLPAAIVAPNQAAYPTTQKPIVSNNGAGATFVAQQNAQQPSDRSQAAPIDKSTSQASSSSRTNYPIDGSGM
jgi:hypothetical protein